MAKHNEIGQKGETIAKEFLVSKGFEILAINWRFRKAEVDIIAKDDEYIVFIEVKTRSYDTVAKPEESVNYKKENLLLDAAEAYMEELKFENEIRFDVIAIVLTETNNTINHLMDVFK